MAAFFDSFGRTVSGDQAGAGGAVALATLDGARAGAWLAYGNGRSYGDSCLNGGGAVADMRGFSRILSFDPATGIVEAEPGVFLHMLIDHCAPHGWFLPVTPGTRFVTLGGAVANDVHGKNHHRRGTFGMHILELDLVRSDRGPVTISPTREPALLAATIGGMGLTGIITRIRLQLIKVGSLDVIESRTPFKRLDDYFDMAEAADADNEYAVAWIDQIHGERGVLMAANHADNGNFETGRHSPRLSVPFPLPFNMLNRASLSAFNAVFHAAKARGAGEKRLTAYQPYFYPLDSVRHWNRLYGPRGLFQHQSVIPFNAARSTVPAMLKASREAGESSFLTVLKRFGDAASPGLMSFPMPGYTLTLDFPNRGRRTLALLERLDAMTRDAGGRVNPYKDARMSAQTFASGFPEWERLEALRDPAMMSGFWRRTAMSLVNGDGRKTRDASNFNGPVKPAFIQVNER